MNGFEHHRSRRKHRHSAAGGFVFGILVTGIGTVMLLSTMGIVNARNIWAYLPLFLVAIGIVRIVEARGNPSGAAFGVILAAGGALWFLDNVGVLWFDKRLIPSLAIIGLGLVFLVRAVERRRAIRTADEPGGAPLSSDPVIHVFTMFGGAKRVIDAADFRGGDAFAMFGGVEMDLRPAIIGDRAVLDVNAIFGGIEIRVPQNWAVEVRGTGIFGGYEDKTLHPPAGDAAPRLIVTGFALFGGISVQN